VWGGLLLGLWVAVLVTVIVLVNALRGGAPLLLRWFEAFYRIGSIIYGGGQVGPAAAARLGLGGAGGGDRIGSTTLHRPNPASRPNPPACHQSRSKSSVGQSCQ
jgi:hypothetical protein